MSLDESIKESMKGMMTNRYRMDVDEVLSWEDKTVGGGYCDTCWYEYDVCEITYRDSTGAVQTWEYSGTFGEFISDLTSDY